MKSSRAAKVLRSGLLFALAAGLGSSQERATSTRPAANATQQQLPEAPGKEVVQKLCGSCHNANLVLGRGMTREEWSEVVSSMISRGAKGTQEEFAQVVDYLATNLPPKTAPGASASSRRRGGGAGRGVGPVDKQIVDAAAADRGKQIYTAQCATCHGADARGSDKGSDLVRSLTLLHDRFGNTLGPFLHKGHPTQSGGASARLGDAAVQDLSHFLHQQVNNTLRSGPYSKVINVLTGDPTAGKVYFNGAGKCSGCHSITGDLAGVASRYDPATLQQRFLFPQAAGFSERGVTPVKPVTVTVTSADGTAVSGRLLNIDDFEVSLRDDAGEYHAWKRSSDLKVEKHDPYAGHVELLDQYTDKDIHDVVAYLETLK